MGKPESGNEVQSGVSVLPRDLITPDEFATLPPGRSVVLTNHLPPVLAHRLELWRFTRFGEAGRPSAPRIGAAVEQDGRTPSSPPGPSPSPADKDRHLAVAF